jgi:hypothetical protein
MAIPLEAAKYKRANMATTTFFILLQKYEIIAAYYNPAILLQLNVLYQLTKFHCTPILKIMPGVG